MCSTPAICAVPQTRIAHEIVERNRGADDVVLVGLYTRGLAIARRLADAIAEFEDLDVPVGALDVSFYRDDIGLRAVTPTGPTEVPVDITGRVVVLVDDASNTVPVQQQEERLRLSLSRSCVRRRTWRPG